MPIPKPYLLIQLMVNDRVAWQVKQEVDAALCRKMSPKELSSMGSATADSLMEIVTDVSSLPSAPEPARKRR